MNEWVDANSAMNYYYDGDYPGEHHCRYSENFDATTEYQGLRFDVPRYIEIAGEAGVPVLEACCGTGRVALPLAGAGFDVTGVDLSPELLRQFRVKLEREPEDVRRRIELIEQDITELSLERRDFALAIVAFNSLLCIPDFSAQCRAVSAIANHLRAGGLLVLDLVNPLQLPIAGDPVAKPFFTRRNPHNGNTYTRFASLSAFDDMHRQKLNGWYDEMDDAGVVTRRTYSITWRPLFRFELQLMLERAGLEIMSLEGGHQKEPYTAGSPRMFVTARRIDGQGRP